MVQGVGLNIWVGLGFRVQGLTFMVYGLRFTVWGLGFTVYGLRFTVYGLRFTAYGLRLMVYGLRFTVYGMGCRVGRSARRAPSPIHRRYGDRPRPDVTCVWREEKEVECRTEGRPRRADSLGRLSSNKLRVWGCFITA